MKDLLLLFCLLSLALPGLAQVEPRDYSVSPPGVEYAADEASALIRFTVSNRGGDASEASRIILSQVQSGRIAAEETLPALAKGEAREFAIRLSLKDLPSEELDYRVEAGIDQYELAGSPIARDNEQRFFVSGTGDAADTAGGPGAPPRFDLWVPILNLGLDFGDEGIRANGRLYRASDIALGLGLLLALLFCLWLLSLILRLIFRRPPRFEAWQPPYAINSWYDPNSALGRRQSWQFHAQNNRINAAPAPDQVAVVKRLTDGSGASLGGWTITAMRAVQYDVYGRVSRSEVVMPHAVIRAMNRVAGRARSLDSAALRKAVAPIAKRMRKRALSAIEKQNASLWIALDMRFEGQTGAVEIHFDLYQYSGDAWRLIDQWQPELAQVGARTPEHFTFTLSGQLPGESYREFKSRLEADMAELLASLFSHPLAAAADEGLAPAFAPENPQPED